MFFHDKDLSYTLEYLKTDKDLGLKSSDVLTSKNTYGKNVLTKRKKKGFFSKLFSALLEPMLVILIFAFVIAFGTNLGKYIKSGDGDFGECFGILFAIVLSVTITLVMESSSERAFEALGRIYERITVKVVREGQIITLAQSELVVGDVVYLESGDKIVADGRLVESSGLLIDESALTGESVPQKKNADTVLNVSKPLAERVNCVYSGTFVAGGNGKMVVTAVGDKTEIGGIAGELDKKQDGNSPLQQKLNGLGKTVSIIGAVTAILVFVISIIKLVAQGNLTFGGVQELFVSCIILIVAAVPEGLPTIVAVSLALNMIKLAKENALIKKMTATETMGAVSVICSDKTGTLTENKMKVHRVCMNQFCVEPDKLNFEPLMQNFVCNSTADLSVKGKNVLRIGSATECALLEAFKKAKNGENYVDYRLKYHVVSRQPFSSDNKYMTTTIKINDGYRKLLKGAPEVVVKMCNLTSAQISKILSDIGKEQEKARRVLCFAHCDYESDNKTEKYVYDGYVSIADPIRKEVYDAVNDCKKAGIKIKMLTGDNSITAYAIAKELGVANSKTQVTTASDIEKLDDETLKRLLESVTVIARSTPIIKLRVVRLLKSMGEVVAVTGDGINDAPAIRHADVGVAMGISGSEITKEAADAVLLDDSFATVVKAVAFGRNVYRNLQRFIIFQLTVNVSALLFITACAVLGVPAPFNTYQLLWINVIMDGPPALTLGLEKAGKSLMSEKPVKRNESIISKKMLFRILVGGIFIGVIMILQYLYNFLKIPMTEQNSAVFTLFILFQLFNAFNCRELGSKSIFKSIGKNKIMLSTFIAVFIVHVLIVQVFAVSVGLSAMCASSWIKTILTAFTVVMLFETTKLVYRLIRNTKEVEGNVRQLEFSSRLNKKGSVTNSD